jgi:RES domain-containing protein
VIVTGIGPNHVCYRSLTPRWSYMPTNGEGAAQQGGRFNRLGVNTLYLAELPETALREAQSPNSSLFHPTTLAAYHLTVEKAVDLGRGYDPDQWDPMWRNWDCAWRNIARVEKRDPPSWLLGDFITSKGCAAIRFPSIRHPGGFVIALYTDLIGPNDRITVHDPDGRLPRSAESWTPRAG